MRQHAGVIGVVVVVGGRSQCGYAPFGHGETALILEVQWDVSMWEVAAIAVLTKAEDGEKQEWSVKLVECSGTQ